MFICFSAYGVNVKRSVICQAHRLGAGIIAEFVWRAQGSTFRYIFSFIYSKHRIKLETSLNKTFFFLRNILNEARKKNKDKRADVPKIFVSMQRSKEDRSIIDKLRSLRKQGLIHSYDRDDTSGKFKLRY